MLIHITSHFLKISVIQLIENGIAYFKELKANRIQENNDLQENTN